MNQLINPPRSESLHLGYRQKPAPVAIIIPACNEEACLGAVLEELLDVVDLEKCIIAVGVNGSSDRTAEIARRYPVIVAETDARGYGFGCTAAIDVATQKFPELTGYIFMAADGASDPHDLRSLRTAAEEGYAIVLGARTGLRSNWSAMSLSHVLANVCLGCWCGVLTGRWFSDLAPLRYIDRELFEAIAPREMTFGWTIEAQIGAALLSATICEVPAHERRRLAGEQKVSGVNWRRTFSIGCRIFLAGWRTRLRFALRGEQKRRACSPELLPQSQPGA